MGDSLAVRCGPVSGPWRVAVVVHGASSGKSASLWQCVVRNALGIGNAALCRGRSIQTLSIYIYIILYYIILHYIILYYIIVVLCAIYYILFNI